MCGIVGYVGRSQAAPILLDGLRRLEYRGYDSAGVAIVNGDHVETRKCAGRIASLVKLISKKPAEGSTGTGPPVGGPMESEMARTPIRISMPAEKTHAGTKA